MANPVRIEFNPAAPTQRIVAFDDGTFQSTGGAPTTTPVIVEDSAIVDFQVCSWSPFKAYCVSTFGTVYNMGSASAASSQPPPGAPFPIYASFYMNPAANGQGYAMARNGLLYPFGTAPAVTTQISPDFSSRQNARKVKMDWATKHFYVLAASGHIRRGNGATAISTLTTWGAADDLARDMEIYDFPNGRGWTLDYYGSLHPINGAETITGGPEYPSDSARDFAIVRTSPAPLQFLHVSKFGGISFWNDVDNTYSAEVSAPTGAQLTRRPTIQFLPVDAEGGALDFFQAKIFTDEVYTESGFSAMAPATYDSTKLPIGDTAGLLVAGGGPSVISAGPSRLDVFIRGEDNRIYWRKLVGVTWYPWVVLGGSTATSDPVAVSWGTDVMHVGIRNSGGGLSLKSTTNGGITWSEWVNMGGTMKFGTKPAIASWGVNRLDVFITNTNGAVHERLWNGAWSPWINHGGVLTGSPAAVAPAFNRIWVFGRAIDGTTYARDWNGGIWSAWHQINPVVTDDSDFGVSANSATSIDLFYTKASDNNVQQSHFAGVSFGAWTNIGNGESSGPPGAFGSGTSIFLFVRGNDGFLDLRVYTAGAWTAWQEPAETGKVFTIPNMLGDNTYRAYVRVGRVVAGADIWSQWDPGPDFSITDPPPTPLAVTPSVGAVIATNTPTLAAVLPAPLLGARVKAQFQIATNSGFTTGLRTITESDTELRLSGITTEPVPIGDKLATGLWYIRARAIDEFGTPSTAWTAAQLFRVSHPPSAINLSPSGGNTQEYPVSGNVEFSWDFSDAAIDDSQSASQIVIEDNTTLVLVTDTGKLTDTTPGQAVAIPAGKKDMNLRWKVRLWDIGDEAGPYTPYSIFRVSDPPTVIVTQPNEGATLTNPQPIINWVFSASGGRTQQQHRIVIQTQAASVTAYDSGWIAGPALTHQPATPVLANDEHYFLLLGVIDSAGLHAIVRVNFDTQWIPPAAPAFSLQIDQYDTLGYVSLHWTNDVQDAEFYSWRIYRMNNDTAIFELVAEVFDSDELMEGFDFFAPSGAPALYVVRQVATRFNVPIESETWPQQVNPKSSHYFLLIHDDASFNQRLSHVISDTFTEEYEEETIQLANKGRKREIGTRYGYVGELVVELYDDELYTAHEKRLRLENLRRERATVGLRNPFGDVWYVSTSDMQVERMPGTGELAYATVTIPYSEVIH